MDNEPNTRVVPVEELKAGDIITNIGIVDTIPLTVGVWRVITVLGTTYQLGTGRMSVGKFDVIRHVSEEVTIDLLDD